MRKRFLTLAIIMTGCVASTSTPSDPGLTAGGASGSEVATNPYGVPYPRTNIGTNASSHDATRNQVGRRGSTMANFTLYGFPDGDGHKGLKRVDLSQYYDPEQKLGYKLIHIMGAGTWCPYCAGEMDRFAPVETTLQGKGVVLITVLLEGPTQGKVATTADLLQWSYRFNPNYGQLIDSGGKFFGGYFDAVTMPWTAWIDPRTMEMLTSTVGVNPGATSEHAVEEADRWINFLATNSAVVAP